MPDQSRVSTRHEFNRAWVSVPGGRRKSALAAKLPIGRKQPAAAKGRLLSVVSASILVSSNRYGGQCCLAPTLAPCHPIGQPWHSRRTAWNTPSAWSTSFQRWRRTTPYVRPHFAPSSQRLKAIGSSFGKRPCSRGGLVCELQLKTAQLDFEWPVATLPAIIF